LDGRCVLGFSLISPAIIADNVFGSDSTWHLHDLIDQGTIGLRQGLELFKATECRKW